LFYDMYTETLPCVFLPAGDDPIDQGGASADDPSVDDRSHDRPPVDAHELSEAEEGKGKNDSGRAAAAVVEGFEFSKGDILLQGDFFHEEFIHFRGDIGMEEEGHAEGRDNESNDIEQDPHPQFIDGHALHGHHPQIEDNAIDEDGNEGKEVRDPEFPENQHQSDEEESLQEVLCGTEGKPGQESGEEAKDDVGGSDDHGHAEVGTFHECDAQG